MAALSVRVPASSANLGPGYDAFAIALGLYGDFSAEPAEEWSVRVVGEGAGQLPEGADNPVALAMRRVFAECGDGDRAARVFCHSRIPMRRGLGSSAAAIVAGCVLADAMCHVPMGRNALFEVAAELEGHADNVAAALFGAFTVSWSDAAGVRCARLDPPGLAAVVLTARDAQSTPAAREVLPASVSHADAAFTCARAGLMASGLVLGRPDLVRVGALDRLHEPYRASAADTAEARRVLLDAGADGVVLSGSGPSLVGLVADVADRTAARRADLVAKRAATGLRGLSGFAEPAALLIDREGAVLRKR